VVVGSAVTVLMTLFKVTVTVAVTLYVLYPRSVELPMSICSERKVSQLAEQLALEIILVVVKFPEIEVEIALELVVLVVVVRFADEIPKPKEIVPAVS